MMPALLERLALRARSDARLAAESGVPAGSAVVYLCGGPRDEDQLMSDLLERLITGIAAALQTI
jgi:hypothetical protein